MAYAYLQEVENSQTASAASLSVVITPQGVGDLLLALTMSSTGGANLFTHTVTDTAGNVWQRAVHTTLNSNSSDIWYANSKGASATTVTMTPQSSQPNLGIAVIEYSGVATPAPFIAAAGANFQNSPGTGTDAITSGASLTISAVPALVFCFTHSAIGQTITANAGTGYTSRIGAGIWLALGSGGNTPLGFFEDLRVASPGSQAGTWTRPGGGTLYYTAMLAFAENPQPNVIAVRQSQPLDLTGPRLFDPQAFVMPIVATLPAIQTSGNIGISIGRRRFTRYT